MARSKRINQASGNFRFLSTFLFDARLKLKSTDKKFVRRKFYETEFVHRKTHTTIYRQINLGCNCNSIGDNSGQRTSRNYYSDSTTGITPEIYNYPVSIVTSAGGNLVGDSPGDSTNTGSPIVYQPTDIRDTNPMLGALQNNGGTTLTHALLAGSPAIDKGLNSLAVNPFNNSILQTDQRGFARIFGSAVDIGAFEAAKSSKRIRVAL